MCTPSAVSRPPAVARRSTVGVCISTHKAGTGALQEVRSVNRNRPEGASAALHDALVGRGAAFRHGHEAPAGDWEEDRGWVGESRRWTRQLLLELTDGC